MQIGEVIPQGSMSVVIRCRAREDRPAILKLTPDTQRLAGETAALQHWSGAHAPDVLDADTDLGALLLEEITPGTTLRQGGDYTGVGDLASLLVSLHGKDPPVVQGTVRSESAVMLPPLLDQYLGFLQRVEDLTVQQLVSQVRLRRRKIAERTG